MNPGNESRQFGDVQDRADDPSGAAGGIVFDHHPGKLDDVVRAVGLEDPVRDGGRLAGSKGAARQAPDALPVVGWHGLEIRLYRRRFFVRCIPNNPVRFVRPLETAARYVPVPLALHPRVCILPAYPYLDVRACARTLIRASLHL